MRNLRVFIVTIVAIVMIAIAATWLAIQNNLKITLILSIVDITLCYYLVIGIRKNFRDVDDFTEAVKYNDFTRRYADSKSHNSRFYRNFNEISEVFSDLSREKDAQQYYLRQILELVDTAIIAYDLDTENVLWQNNAFKELFLVPEIKNLDWLKKRSTDLYREFVKIKSQDEYITNFNREGVLLKLIINVSQFATESGQYRIIAVHNISSTMDEIEARAWKGLLGVMTHEIMNSITPVVSLTQTIKDRIDDIKKESGDIITEEMEEIELGIDTIKRRSEGLLKFSDTYHNLSRVIVPDMKEFDLILVAENIKRLMLPSLRSKGIEFGIKTTLPSIIVDIDAILIEQAVINLITNAAYALKDTERPKIEIHIGEDKDSRAYITVADNGCGISEQIRDKIYIPFFTTRKSGNGIGLTLTREIIKLHGASLLLQTKEGEGSAFTILF